MEHRKRAEMVIHHSLPDRFRVTTPTFTTNPLGKIGGTLEGYMWAVERGYFEELGITHLQLTPLCYQGPNQRVWNDAAKRFDELSHGYGCWSFFKHDPTYGSLRKFRRFTEQDLGVIYDLQHHTRSRNAPVFRKRPDWLAEGVYQDPTWDLHCLNFENRAARTYFIRYVRNWVFKSSDAGRLDSCHEMLRHFQAYPEILRELSDLFLIGELLEGNVSTFHRFISLGLPSATNYPVYYLLSEQISHAGGDLEKVADTLFHLYVELAVRPWKLVNFVENHDMVLYRQLCLQKGESPQEADDRFRMAYALCFYLPGIPSVYYTSPKGYIGTNFGDENRSGRPVLEWEEGWGEFYPFLASLARARRNNTALVYGSYSELWRPSWSNPGKVFAFARQHQGQTIVVVVNNGNSSEFVNIPVSIFGVEDASSLAELLGQDHDLFVQDGVLLGTIAARTVLALQRP
jgi:neopullulanase